MKHLFINDRTGDMIAANDLDQAYRLWSVSKPSVFNPNEWREAEFNESVVLVDDAGDPFSVMACNIARRFNSPTIVTEEAYEADEFVGSM